MLLIKVLLCIIFETQACHAFTHEWFPDEDPKKFIQKRNERIIELLRNPKNTIEEHVHLYGEDAFSIEIFGKVINFTSLFVIFKDV